MIEYWFTSNKYAKTFLIFKARIFVVVILVYAFIKGKNIYFYIPNA